MFINDFGSHFLLRYNCCHCFGTNECTFCVWTTGIYVYQLMYWLVVHRSLFRDVMTSSAAVDLAAPQDDFSLGILIIFVLACVV